MAVPFCNYLFEGPFTSTEDIIPGKQGVYVILCRTSEVNFGIIDFGESGNVRERIESHERKNCWFNNCNGEIIYAVYYPTHEPEFNRLAIESEIRTKYTPLCGER